MKIDKPGVKRSKWATDVFYRLWDEHNSCWVSANGRSLWSRKGQVERIRAKMIEAGRNPATLSVDRVLVEAK